MITISVWGIIALTYDFATLVAIAIDEHHSEAPALVSVAAVVNLVCLFLWLCSL
jgi:hypothetical protein